MFVNDWNLSYNGKTLNISKEDLEKSKITDPEELKKSKEIKY